MPTTSDNSVIYHLPYVAYLIRFWKESGDSAWRASAQSVQTGEIMRFGSQQALFAFLEAAIHTTKERTDHE